MFLTEPYSYFTPFPFAKMKCFVLEIAGLLSHAYTHKRNIRNRDLTVDELHKISLI